MLWLATGKNGEMMTLVCIKKVERNQREQRRDRKGMDRSTMVAL